MMTTMKNNSISVKLMAVMFSLFATNCSDFLEKPLQGQLTQENFPVTANDALLATNAMYNVLRSSGFHQGVFPIMDIMSDDARKGSNPGDGASTVGSYDSFSHIPTESNNSTWWSALYEGIKRTNVVINGVALIEMDQTLKSRYISEAHFIRALFYFDLVRAWGDVPLVTEGNPARGAVRTPQAEVYDLIENDLLAAIGGLPEKSQYAGTDMGRATKGAARALLARVSLFQKDFINAEKYALEVINSGEYNLTGSFEDANSKAGEFGGESIFEIGAMPFEGIENGGNQYANVQGVRGTPNRGWGFNRPSLDLQNSFESGDPRLQATVIYLGEVIDGVTITGDGGTPDEIRNSGGDLIEIECYNQKVWTPGVDVPTQHDHNKRLLRYADVLLMAAEALNENDKAAEALPYLNQVRARARNGNALILPDITETNKTLLQTIILNERRHELAMEGHRFWDLIRTGRAEAVLGPLGFVVGKHELLPIPQSEMDLTNNSWEQNPGWNQ
jgi:hypothetical protein